MEIKTKFQVGDKVCCLDTKTMKAKTFVVGFIHIYIGKDGKPDIDYKPESENPFLCNERYAEDKVFANEQALVSYITTPLPPTAKK